MADVSTWSFEKRLGETFTRCLPKLGPEARAQLAALITPEALAIIAGVLVAWVVSHAFGIGAVVDIVILTVGILGVGMAIFTGLDHLYEFATGAYRARTEQDLERAAEHLAQAIVILGVQAVLAVLFRRARPPLTGRGGRPPVGQPPWAPPGWRYQPRTRAVNDPDLSPGEGRTTAWGDIRYSMFGAVQDQRLALLHERVHQFLTPKIYFLRQFRVEAAQASYMRSSLRRYLEEALAETAAQLGVHGFRQFFTGVRFPVRNGYVFLWRGGADPRHLRPGGREQLGGHGVIPEAMALLWSGMVAGISYSAWFVPAPPRDQ